MDRARGDGVTAVAFGDLFLEDVRRYREDRMRGTGLTPLFPIWGIPTTCSPVTWSPLACGRV